MPDPKQNPDEILNYVSIGVAILGVVLIVSVSTVLGILFIGLGAAIFKIEPLRNYLKDLFK
jgi:ABC-type phosphate transport system permease subunit